MKALSFGVGLLIILLIAVCVVLGASVFPPSLGELPELATIQRLNGEPLKCLRVEPQENGGWLVVSAKEADENTICDGNTGGWNVVVFPREDGVQAVVLNNIREGDVITAHPANFGRNHVFLDPTKTAGEYSGGCDVFRSPAEIATPLCGDEATSIRSVYVPGNFSGRWVVVKFKSDKAPQDAALDLLRCVGASPDTVAYKPLPSSGGVVEVSVPDFVANALARKTEACGLNVLEYH